MILFGKVQILGSEDSKSTLEFDSLIRDDFLAHLTIVDPDFLVRQLAGHIVEEIMAALYLLI